MESDLRKAYSRLLAKTKDLIVLQSAEAIVQWDMETKMPPRAVEQRSLQLALISSIGHKMSTDKEVERLLKQIEKDPGFETLSQIEKRNLFLIKRNYIEQTALPDKLVNELAKQQALTVNVWKKAKKMNDFGLLKPDLSKLLDLTKQKGEILMKAKETATPYDALIDEYEPRMTQKKIASIFDSLQKGIESLLEKIQATRLQVSTGLLNQEVPVDKQRKIATNLTEILGYDTTSTNAAGRIDETEHPFTSGYYDDVRIATHYYPNNFASSIFSVLHETGHALYDQNLNSEWKYQPVGSHCSMGIHESQSRFAENIIGRSQEFWTFALLKLKRVASELKSIELDPFIRSINKVEPSKIRVEADEVTYSLHIIIRFQMESDLFSGGIQVDELPQVWNEKYDRLLGVKIENDSEGIMQDTHWSSGYFGYFPSYALGNIYSGQILSKTIEDMPNWQEDLTRGNLQRIQNWLAQNIHKKSNIYDPEQLIKEATQRELNSKPYLDYLIKKYSRLYEF